MRVTSHGHAAVVLEHDGSRLAIDPGTFADAAAALSGSSAILITHEHPDHVDGEAIRDRLGDPTVQVWAPEPVVDLLRVGLPADVADRIHTASPGDRFEAAGFTVTVAGGLHALIHEALPRAENRTYLVEGGGVAVFHPGDSFDDPPSGSDLPPVDVLLVPVSGPWLRLGEAMDLAAGIDAPIVIPIHGALLSELGWGLVDQRMDSARIAGTYSYRRLAPGESVEVSSQ
jgi:L-ascorbate metabolism protein UlaG (beta-lactamase superfamily)